MSRALVLGAVLAVVVFALAACSGASQAPAPTTTTSAPVETQVTTPSATPTESTTPSSTPAETVTELQIKDKVVGKGATAKAGDSITVDYTGWLMDGTKFDSSIGRAPLPFVVGAGQMIEGMDKGVVGMKVGGTRILVIPSAMAYGPVGSPGVIPPNATLKFEVKLLTVGPAQ